MIYSVVSPELIFGSKSESNLEYAKSDNVLMEISDGRVRRIISTDPADFISVPMMPMDVDFFYR